MVARTVSVSYVLGPPRVVGYLVYTLTSPPKLVIVVYTKDSQKVSENCHQPYKMQLLGGAGR